MEQSKQLSLETHCILLISGYKIYITGEEANKIANAWEKGDIKIVKLKDESIAMSSIAAILKASKVEEQDRLKKGEWKCHWGFYHKKGEECAHHILGIYADGTSNN